MKIDQTCILRSFLVGLLFITFSCDNANNIESPDDKYFVKYYGEDGDQQAVDMVVNSDGSILLLGNSTAGSQRVLIVMVDPKGNIKWQKKLGTSTDVAKDIEPTSDGNYVVLSDFQKSENDNDVKLIRIRSDGTKIDSATIGTEESGNFYNDHSKSITPTSDQGFIVTGYADYDYSSSDNVDRASSIFHFRFDTNLVPYDKSNWENYYGTGTTNIGTKVIQRGDEFYVFGYTDSKSTLDNPNNKLLLMYYSLDQKGFTKNPAYIGDLNEDTEADFILSVPSVLTQGYLVVSTSNGNTLSSKLRVSLLRDPLQFVAHDDQQFDFNIFGGRRLDAISASSSLSIPNGFLILSNEIKETGETDVMLSKINQSGEELWAVNFGGENNDKAAAVTELPDGRILVFCTVETIVQTKMALFKVNSNGQLLN